MLACNGVFHGSLHLTGNSVETPIPSPLRERPRDFGRIDQPGLERIFDNLLIGPSWSLISPLVQGAAADASRVKQVTLGKQFRPLGEKGGFRLYFTSKG